jgi:hypothetical protein
MMFSDNEASQFTSSLRLAQVKAPSLNGTHNLTHAYARSQAWVWNTPLHIGASYHLLHSQGHEICILRCSQNSLEWIPTRCVPWKIPMCSHGSSLPLASLSFTMWKHNLLSRIGQVPRPNVAQPWWHEYSLPFPQTKHLQPSNLRSRQNS